MRIKLKKSKILNAGTAVEPDPSNLEYGEIAINYNSADPCLFIKTSDDTILKFKLEQP